MDFKNKGNELFSQGKNREAIQQYSKGIEKMLTTGSSSSLSAEDKKLLCILHSNKAQVHLELDQFREAADSAAESLKVDPAWQKSVFRRITALFKLKAWTELCNYIENDDTLIRPDDMYSFSHDVREFIAKMVHDAPKEDAATDKDQVGRRRAFALHSTFNRKLTSHKEKADAKRKHEEIAEIRKNAQQEEQRRIAQQEAANRKRRVTLHPDLYDCLNRIACESTRSKDERPSRFYPGGPKWIEDPGALFDACMDLHWEKCHGLVDAMTTLANAEKSVVKRQQEVDRARKVIAFVYENELGENGEKELSTRTFTLDEHRAIHKKAGYTLNLDFPENTLPDETKFVDLCVQQKYGPISQSPIESGGDQTILSKFRYRCAKCKAILDLDDPAQCNCGEHYCSATCHALDFDKHRSVCLTYDQHPKVVGMYWDCILHGALDWPAGNLIKDYRKIWFDEKLPELLEKHPCMTMLDAVQAETEFYETTERPETQERMEKNQEKYNACSNQQVKPFLLTRVLGEIAYQHFKYRTPLYSDSPGRLMFKIMMAPVYQNIVFEQGISAFRVLHKSMHSEDKVIERLTKEIQAAEARFKKRFQSIKKSHINEFD